MKILKAITTDGKTEVFSLNKIISFSQHGDSVKILAGAGLYWYIRPESITIEDMGYNDLEALLKGGI